MKLLKFVTTLLTISVASVFASGGEADDEITFYGCLEECSAQRNPSCPQFDDDDLPTNFAALSTKLSHYDDYCGHYAIFFPYEYGSRLGKATVVDSCSSCAKYHLDLSKKAFTKFVGESKGTAKIVWGIYSKSGNKLAGPFYSSASSAAKKFGMSSDAFLSAFNASARRLAVSSDSNIEFSKNASAEDKVTKKATTTTKTIKTIKSVVSTSRAPFPLVTKKVVTPTVKQVQTPINQNIPPKQVATSINQVGTPVNQVATPVNQIATPVNQIGTPSDQIATPANEIDANNDVSASAITVSPAEPVDQVNKAVDEEKEGGLGAVGILAIGGGCLGAAGAGLIFMKRKSPNTYEDLKQKFPEAFTTVKRGISRSATSIKRRVTKRETVPQYQNNATLMSV